MNPSKRSLSPAWVASLTVAFPLVYVLLIGPERFWYESWGTWIVSPVIYARISPSPLNEWLIRGFVHGQPLTFLSYAAPIALLAVSGVLAVLSVVKNSLLSALCAVLLVTIVFGVYHFLQPLGMSFVSY